MMFIKGTHFEVHVKDMTFKKLFTFFVQNMNQTSTNHNKFQTSHLQHRFLEKHLQSLRLSFLRFSHIWQSKSLYLKTVEVVVL